MGFAQGLSGLNSASKALEAIGNNVANAATVGFKSANAQFGDVFATSLSGGGASQIGIGVAVARVSQQFSQGNVTTSGNPLDIAINGGGMFRLNTNGTITYTRNGQFQLDKSGYIVNAMGKQLTGYAADPTTGTIVPGNFVALQMNNAPIPPVATLVSQIQVNLDSRNLPPTAMTAGASVGGLAPTLPLTVVAGTNDKFDITVDGIGPKTVTVPVAIYATIGDLATAATTAINSAFSSTTAAVDVTANNAGQLVVTSRSVGTFGSQGMGSTVVLAQDTSATPTTGFEVLFAGPGAGGPPVVYTPGLLSVTTGQDNFTTTDTTSFNASTAQTVYDSLGNPHTLSLYFTRTSQSSPTSWQMYSTIDSIAAPSHGATSGTTALGTPPSSLTVAAPDNVFTIDVDGSGAKTVTIPVLVAPAVYTATSLVAAIQNEFNIAVPPILATASLDTYGRLVIESNTTNVGSTLVMANGAGSNAITKLFGTPTQTSGGPAKVDTLQFDTSGALTTTTPISESFTLTTGAKPLAFTVNLTGSTQYGIGFGVNQLLQDGYTSGKLSGLSVSADGIVQGNYSNGKSRNMGQIVLGTFNNPNGLLSLGGNQWAETATSGQPIPGVPGSGSLGTVQSGAVEESNVDLTAELVQMITQQRAYQANAQTVKTLDQIMQTLVNLR
ncbi:MAG: flagellar hook protein FlgE [Sterolibacterium sp.]|nr:flagellar hook protein FlgE [Sterolibacterium sp.]